LGGGVKRQLTTIALAHKNRLGDNDDMAGAFAHMSVADSLCDEPEFLISAGRIGEIARYAITKNKNFCELGSVSPDLPYLDFLNANSKGWANVMHYWKTADIIRSGVSCFAGKNLEDGDKLRALAWFFGYAAHVATDLTVHPVLAASGYPYATNAKGHRLCELNQDAYIFRKLNSEDPDDVRYIENCGIGSCGDPNDPAKLYPAVRELWTQCLSCISPPEVHMENGTAGPVSRPTPDVWFADYTKRVGEFVEQGGGFVLLFRDLLEKAGACLPESGEVDMKYITNLKTPTNLAVDYDTVFAMSLANVRKTWLELAAALAAPDQNVFALKNADLDTGEADDDKKQVFFA
jgi:hypothetical protein